MPLSRSRIWSPSGLARRMHGLISPAQRPRRFPLIPSTFPLRVFGSMSGAANAWVGRSSDAPSCSCASTPAASGVIGGRTLGVPSHRELGKEGPGGRLSSAGDSA